MIEFWEIAGGNLILVFGLSTLLWIASLVLRNASIVDPCWGLGFVIIAWATWLREMPSDGYILLLLTMVTLWGLRLSVYLTWRNWGEEEDRRYAAMRAKHGSRFGWVSLFTVFWLQALIMWFVSLTIQAGLVWGYQTGWMVFAIMGFFIWSIGLFFETVGDYQMRQFQADPENRGRVMDRGLWRYTRHPNYFGDFCVWWGFFLFACSAGGGWTILGPLLMSFLLLKVSGVTLLEKDMRQRRPEYARYQQETNAFFPGPVRKINA